MKLAVFIPSFRGGGAERAMLSFARGAIEAGCSVDLLVAQNSGPLKQELPKGASLIDFNKPRVIATLLQLRSYLKEERPAAIYATMTHVNIVAIIAAKLAGVSTRVVVREANVVFLPDGQRRSLAQRSLRYLIPLIYPGAHRIIAVSNAVADELGSLSAKLRKKISVLPTPAISSEILQLAEQPLPHPWFQENQPPVLLAAGRLRPQKDFATLLRAFAEIRRQREVRLVILGEGPEKEKLENLAEQLGVAQDVDFPGFVNNPFVYLKRAAVFVLSSVYEGMPNVLLQALACGTPVVSTDCRSGPGEIITDRSMGRLVPVGDADAMAQAVLEVLDNPPELQISQQIVDVYGVQEAAEKYLQVLAA